MELEGPRSLSGVEVMVVDEDRAAAVDLAAVLGERGASTTVWEGAVLDDALRDRRLVVVLGAEIDGEGLARCDALREEHPGLRIVVGTQAISRETLTRHARSVTAADAYLRKPYDEERAVDCIARVAEGPPSPDERLWWLDDQQDEPDPPDAATGSGSGSPVGVPPGFRFS